MTTPLESAIVRLYTASNKIVGAGFLITDRHILTCAHVVTDALGLSNETRDFPEGYIQLDFPLLAPGQILTARVCNWHPPTDIAGLELKTPPPIGAIPVNLVATGDIWGHPFRVFGFPAGYDQGVWVSGVVQGRQATGWLQMEGTKTTGYVIVPGFSGSPVWINTFRGRCRDDCSYGQ